MYILGVELLFFKDCIKNPFFAGRNVLVINLDPGNDVQLPYDAAVDVCELITVEDVMSIHQLGPNGGLIHCMEFLETNYNWLVEKISAAISGLTNPYVLIDSPGQVELYIHNSSLRNVVNRLMAKSCPLDFRLCAVNLVDSYYANDPGMQAMLITNHSIIKVNKIIIVLLFHAFLRRKIHFRSVYLFDGNAALRIATCECAFQT